MSVVDWNYFKVGACDNCDADGERLYAPVFDKLRCVTPPLLCARCRDTYKTNDLSTTCPTCLVPMTPEHAHFRCPKCGYRDSCCM